MCARAWNYFVSHDVELMDYKSNSKRIFSLLLNFFFCVFFLGEAHDKHVNTHLSLGVNPTHNSSRVSNNNLVINMMDTSKTEICVRTLPYAFSILYSNYQLPKALSKIHSPRWGCHPLQVWRRSWRNQSSVVQSACMSLSMHHLPFAATSSARSALGPPSRLRGSVLPVGKSWRWTTSTGFTSQRWSKPI
jgi:hypothetical protein